MFFYPHSYLIDTPTRHGVEYESENFQAADGTSLNAWFLPANSMDGSKAKATILFCMATPKISAPIFVT